MVLGRPGRGDVGRRADQQHPVETEAPRLAEHLAQRPGGQPATARRRPDAVADVARPADEVAGLVAQRDRPQHLAVVHDPRYVQCTRPASAGRVASDWAVSRSTQAANPAGEATSSWACSPKPSSCRPGPHSAWASSQAACRRTAGAISSGMSYGNLSRMYRTAAYL